MVSSVALLRLRALRLAGALAAGLLLVFGGTCGAGPTTLSVLAVSGVPNGPADDARAQAPAPVSPVVATPDRRVVRRRVAAARARARAVVGRARAAIVAAAVALAGAPPPLRGPPSFVG